MISSEQGGVQLLLVLDDEASFSTRLVADKDLLSTWTEVRVAADHRTAAICVLNALAVRALVLEVVRRIHHHAGCCRLNHLVSLGKFLITRELLSIAGQLLGRGAVKGFKRSHGGSRGSIEGIGGHSRSLNNDCRCSIPKSSHRKGLDVHLGTEVGEHLIHRGVDDLEANASPSPIVDSVLDSIGPKIGITASYQTIFVLSLLSALFLTLKLEVVGPGRGDVLIILILSPKTPSFLRLVVVVRVGVVHCLVWFMVMMFFMVVMVVLPSSSKKTWPALGGSTKEHSNDSDSPAHFLWAARAS